MYGIEKPGIFWKFMHFIEHCFICRLSNSTVSEIVGIEPRTAAIFENFVSCFVGQWWTCDPSLCNMMRILVSHQCLHIFHITLRISMARHQCLRIFHITMIISVTLHQNLRIASSMFADFPHSDENFSGASSNLAHFPHCDENFGDTSSKIGGPHHPFPQLPQTWTLILYYIPVLYIHTYT